MFMRQTLIFVIFALFSQPAFAAELIQIDEPRSEHMESFHFGFNQLRDYLYHDDIYIAARSLKVISKKPGEAWENTLKQAIYITRGGGYSTPEYVDVKRIKRDRNTIHKQFRELVDGALNNPPEQELNDVEDQLRLALWRNDTMLFEGRDGNSFGTCYFLAIVDLTNQELTIANSCYSE